MFSVSATAAPLGTKEDEAAVENAPADQVPVGEVHAGGAVLQTVADQAEVVQNAVEGLVEEVTPKVEKPASRGGNIKADQANIIMFQVRFCVCGAS